MPETMFGRKISGAEILAGWSGGQSGGSGMQTEQSGDPPEESAPRRKTNLYKGSLSVGRSGLGPDGSA
jgi:hypothetical protein